MLPQRDGKNSTWLRVDETDFIS